MIAEVDDDMTGSIDFPEFLRAIESQKRHTRENTAEDETLDAFVACGGKPDKKGEVETDRWDSAMPCSRAPSRYSPARRARETGWCVLFGTTFSSRLILRCEASRHGEGNRFRLTGATLPPLWQGTLSRIDSEQRGCINFEQFAALFDE